MPGTWKVLFQSAIVVVTAITLRMGRTQTAVATRRML